MFSILGIWLAALPPADTLCCLTVLVCLLVDNGILAVGDNGVDRGSLQLPSTTLASSVSSLLRRHRTTCFRLQMVSTAVMIKQLVLLAVKYEFGSRDDRSTSMLFTSFKNAILRSSIVTRLVHLLLSNFNN